MFQGLGVLGLGAGFRFSQILFTLKSSGTETLNPETLIDLRRPASALSRPKPEPFNFKPEILSLQTLNPEPLP